jgi:hypothetical protein
MHAHLPSLFVPAEGHMGLLRKNQMVAPLKTHLLIVISTLYGRFAKL